MVLAFPNCFNVVSLEQASLTFMALFNHHFCKSILVLYLNVADIIMMESHGLDADEVDGKC